MSQTTGYADLDSLAERVERLTTLEGKELEAEEIALLGRKSGLITTKLKTLAKLPLEERRSYGARLNELRVKADSILVQKRAASTSVDALIVGADLTMPARHRWVGAEHPVTKVVDEIVEIFRGIGFTVAVGPEGGFTDGEIAAAVAAGWRTVTLGPRTLRVETAAIALAVLSS